MTIINELYIALSPHAIVMLTYHMTQKDSYVDMSHLSSDDTYIWFCKIFLILVFLYQKKKVTNLVLLYKNLQKNIAHLVPILIFFNLF